MTITRTGSGVLGKRSYTDFENSTPVAAPAPTNAGGSLTINTHQAVAAPILSPVAAPLSPEGSMFSFNMSPFSAGSLTISSGTPAGAYINIFGNTPGNQNSPTLNIEFISPVSTTTGSGTNGDFMEVITDTEETSNPVESTNFASQDAILDSTIEDSTFKISLAGIFADENTTPNDIND